MPLTITPITPVFGARLSGVDIGEPLNEAAFGAIRDAFDAMRTCTAR